MTPREAHAGIVTLLPAAADASALAAALANHGVTVTARGASIRVSAHVGTGADSLLLLGDALADAASRRVSAVDFGGDPGGEISAAEIITIEVIDAPPAPETRPEGDAWAEPATGAVPGAETVSEIEAVPDDALDAEAAVDDAVDAADDEIVIATIDDAAPDNDGRTEN